MPDISVVICTYNGANRLEPVLRHLAAQQTTPELVWDVLVVDNASTDATCEVVSSFAEAGLLPQLRYCHEAEPGLTAARQAGVNATDSEWIAFVDDDNLLEPGWIAAMAKAISDHPDAGGFGGEIVLDWPQPPPGYLRPFGFCFAEQPVGADERQADSLAGAGMVLRRRALQESGWLKQPLLPDRTGTKLVSGGDVEIAQRIRSAGYGLWLIPTARLRHRIPSARMSRSYLFRINFELGMSSAVVGLLTWPGDWPSWRRHARNARAEWLRKAAGGLAYVARRRTGFTVAFGWACFAWGFAQGTIRCHRLSEPERLHLLGAAALRLHDP